jgi:hypothetical protein
VPKCPSLGAKVKGYLSKDAGKVGSAKGFLIFGMGERTVRVVSEIGMKSSY